MLVRSLRSLARRGAAAGVASALALTLFNAAQPSLGGHRVHQGTVKDIPVVLAPAPVPATAGQTAAPQAKATPTPAPTHPPTPPAATRPGRR